MKKLVLFLCLLLVTSFKVAEAADIQPSNIISNIKDSVLIVTTKRNSLGDLFRTGQKGTGFVVEASKEKTIVCTAEHVIDDIMAAGFAVEYNSKEYKVSEVSKVENSDVAYLTIKPGIIGVKALQFELSDSTAKIDALAFGFAHEIHLINEPPTVTFTYGKLSRNVCEKITFGDDSTLYKYIIYGTPTLLNGYSGGPCLTTDYKIIGMNHGYSNEMTIFIDGRAIYNNIPGNKNSVRVPYDDTFNVRNSNTTNRISNNNSSIIIGDSEQLLEQYIQKFMFGFLSKPFMGIRTRTDWIDSPSNSIRINNKKYKIYKIEIKCKNYLITNKYVIGYQRGNNYIYFCSNGWSVLLDLSEE